MQKRCFLSYEKPVTICRWIFLDISVTFTASLASTRRRACAAIRGTPGALFFPCVAAEKNSLRPVRTRPCHFLRSTHAVDSRPLLWRQARLPLLECSPRALLALWQGKDRTSRLVGGAAQLHPAVRLLRWSPLPRHTGESRGRGVQPRLAHRQGTRQALHARATAAGSCCQSNGHRHR